METPLTSATTAVSCVFIKVKFIGQKLSKSKLFLEPIFVFSRLTLCALFNIFFDGKKFAAAGIRTRDLSDKNVILTLLPGFELGDVRSS